MSYQSDTFHRAPRDLRAEAPTAFERHTTGLSNGGRSLKAEHLELHRTEYAAVVVAALLAVAGHAA